MTISFALPQDPFNLIITGVGGQGNVMASRVLAKMLVRRGYRVTIGETFGMSQRGGSVMSHLRISQGKVWSPQIPKGRANLVVSLEPIEAIRVLKEYGNPSTVVLVNKRPIYPVGVITGELRYPETEEIRKAIESLSKTVFFLDATKQAIKLGNPILSNIVMIGAVTGTGLLPLDEELFEKIIREAIPAGRVDANLKAFKAGKEALEAVSWVS